MKKLFFVKLLIVATILSIVASCSSTSSLDGLQGGINLSGLDAADFYLSYLEKSEDEKIRWNYVYSLYEGESYEKALEETRKGMELYPDYIRFNYLEALILNKMEKTEEELQSLLKAEAINPSNLDIKHRILELYNLFNMKEEAEEEAWSILAYSSDDENAIEALSSSSPFFSSYYESIKKVEEKEANEIIENPESEEESQDNDL